MFNNVKKFFLYYSILFLISSIVLFTAYNWQNIGNIEKISIPLSLTIISGILGMVLTKKIYRNLAYLFSSFLIGVTFATIGQIYQTGADSWVLFALWSVFLIIPMLVSRFYGVVGLFTATLYIGFLLFLGYETDINGYYSTFLLGIILIFYPLLSKKIKFNGVYYYTVFIVYSFFNRGYRLLEFKDDITLTQDILALVFLFLIYIIGYVKEEKIYVNPICLINLALIILGILESIFNFNYSDYIFWLIALILFIVVLYQIVCFSKKENVLKLGEKLKISYITRFTKIMIIIFAVGLIESIFYVFELEKIGLILISLFSFLTSWFYYKVIKTQEKQCELIFLSLGMITLNIYLSEEWNFSLLYMNVVSIIIFDLFYYFRYKKIMDYLFAGFHIFVICLILEKLGLNFIDHWLEKILYTMIFSVVTLSILLKNKIEVLKNKERIVRILRGNEIFLICVFILSYKDSIFYKLPYTYLYVALAILVILKEKFSENLKYDILFGVLIGTVSYISLSIPVVSFGLLLFLIYNLRKEKIAICLSIFIITVALNIYYYNLDINLLEKSILLLKASAISFIVFLVWKFLPRGEKIEK